MNIVERKAPLIRAPLDEPIALLCTALPALGGRTGKISRATFLSHVNALAEKLPTGLHAINLCTNRYLFMVAFCAALVRQQTTLLPQNRGIATQQQLLDEYPDSYVLHDGCDEIAVSAHFNINEHEFAAGEPNEIPQIALTHLAAIAFTSGSTGKPSPNFKTWQTFVDSTAINAANMLADSEQQYFMLATVPAQHMWGLETSVLIPMMARVCICDAKPLFPQDINKTLSILDHPRMLVSTPVHLRALTMSALNFPELTRTLCATAPLLPALARDVELSFKGELIEIFGCSEVGSMAFRRSAQEEDWHLFQGLEFEHNLHSDQFEIHAKHLPGPVELQDRIARGTDRAFRLLGRNADMIEIAGKRGSLQEMNKILLSAPNVADGVVFIRDEDGGKLARPAALVVVNGSLSKTELLEYFSERLDPVFLPRPLYFVDSLPRQENGKLPRNILLAFFKTLKA